jgi:hypothetical protein
MGAPAGDHGVVPGCAERAEVRHTGSSLTTSMANQVSSLAAAFLVAPEFLAGDELNVIASRDMDHGAADALDAGIALIALPTPAEERTAVLVARSPRSRSLEALLAALGDRDQLGLDLAAALDRRADGIGVTSACHRSEIHPLARAYHPNN